MRGARAALAGLPLLGLAVGLLVHGPYLSHDAAMYAQVGERVLAGQRVYVDLFELNPPLVMWLSAGPAALGRALGVGTEAVVAWGTLALVVASGLFAAQRARGWVGDGAAAAGLWLWGALHLGYFTEWGQREQLFVCVYLMYTAVAAGGAWPLRLGVGVALGLIGCLKPHFVVVVAAVELLQLADGRGLRGRPWLPLAGATAAGLGYAVALATMAAEGREHLFHVLIPMVAAGYHRFDDTPWVLVGSPWLVLPLLQAAAHLRWGAGPATDLSRRLAAWAVVALLLFVQQGKFWVYHQIPVAVPVVLGGGLLVWASGLWRRPAAGAALVAVAVAGAAAPLAALRAEPMAVFRGAGPALAAWVEPGDEVQLYTLSVGPYHTLSEAGLRNARTYLWDYPLALAPDALPPAYVASVHADLARRPQVVLLDLPERCPGCEAGLEQGLRQLGVWDTLERDYAVVGEAGLLRVLRRR